MFGGFGSLGEQIESFAASNLAETKEKKRVLNLAARQKTQSLATDLKDSLQACTLLEAQVRSLKNQLQLQRALDPATLTTLAEKHRAALQRQRDSHTTTLERELAKQCKALTTQFKLEIRDRDRQITGGFGLGIRARDAQ